MSFSFSKAAKSLVAGGVVVMIAANGFAANQGGLGATSTGDLNISLNVADEVRITNLTDITLGQYAGADLTGSSEACIYRSGTGAYQITATGSGALGAFELSDGATNTVDYTVTYQETAAPSAVALTAGTALTGQVSGDPASQTCATAGINTGTLIVNVLDADLAALPAATYNGLLTLSVSPE